MKKLIDVGDMGIDEKEHQLVYVTQVTARRDMSEQELIEQLADKEHASWARWMQYLFSQCEDHYDINAYGVEWYAGKIITPDQVSHWQRQIDTPYDELSEREKQSDRAEVAHILPIIEEYSSQEALSKGVMTINEARSLKGLPPLDR